MNLRSITCAALLLTATTFANAEDLADPTRPPSARDTYDSRAGTWSIVRIDPASGCIEARADLGALWRSFTEADKKQVTSSEQNVLNGIAHDKTTGNFYVTGKNWRTIFIGKFLAPR